MGVVKSYSHFCFKEGLILEEIWKDVVGWHWLNKVTKMPKEWQERRLKYYD